ncbi:MAG: glycosyl transferase family 1 [Flavipsychrobacter sp.]|nr:glycosyl transferase family 1 [Flavipsychrobacter sp.]
MRIAILGTAHPLRGGLAAFNERLAYQLQEQGHEVVIYSFSLQYPSFLFPGKTQFTDEPAPKGLTIKTVVNSVNPLNWLRVGAQMNKERYDLVVVKYWLPFMGPAFGTILRRAKKNKHTKVLCVVDNIIPHEKRPGDQQFTNYFIKAVDAFVTMSKDVLKDVKTFTDKPAYFTPHPVYDSYNEVVSKQEACAKIGLPDDKKYLLFFGFIREYKGLDLLLEAMADARIRQAGIELIAAGEYYNKEVEANNNSIIEKHQLQKTVHLRTDFIPNSEVRYYFSAADLVVQPYKHATQSGITQIAFHFEKPMVVTNVGGLAEVVPDGKVGFVAEPNPKSIADAILKFYEPNSIPGLHQHILNEKKKYMWDTFTDVMMKAVFGR